VRRILFVDDESTFLHSTAELIGKEGYEVNCVESTGAREAGGEGRLSPCVSLYTSCP
jgi:CheY-like chemotaxis protein